MTITSNGLVVSRDSDGHTNSASFAMIVPRDIPVGSVLVYALAVDNSQTTDGDEGAITALEIAKAGWEPDITPYVTVSPDDPLNYLRGVAAYEADHTMMQVLRRRSTGKWFFQATLYDDDNGSVYVGLANASADNDDWVGADSGSIGLDNRGPIYSNGSQVGDEGTGWSYNSLPTISVAVDLDARTIWFKVNSGDWNGSPTADPATGEGGINVPVAGALSPAASTYWLSSGEYVDIDLNPLVGSPPVSPAPEGFTNWDVPPDITFAKASEFCNGNGAAKAGVTVSGWYAKVTEEIKAGSRIVATLSNSADRDTVAALLWEFEATGPLLAVEGTPATLANDAADPGSLNVTTSNGEWLRIRLIGSESSSSTALTPTANFTQMTNVQDGVGVRGEFIIASGTGAASDPTLFAADQASVYFVLRDLSAGIGGGGAYASGRADQGHSTGKRYFEIRIDANANSAMSPPVGAGIGFGLSVAGGQLDLAVGNMSAAYSVGLYTDGVMLTDTGTDADLNLPIQLGEWARCAVDFDAGKVWFGNAGGWSGDPAAGTGEADTFTPNTTLYPTFTATSLTDRIRANFGASDVALPVPSGFSTWDE